MKQIPLTKIGFFNPGRLTDEEIEQMFITRVPFFEHLFKKIIAETPGSIPQHYLIIGQRGMGKTSLLIRIAAELRKKPYSDSFIALTFPEEQYNVDRLSKFWLNCMDALADALDKENNKELLPALDNEIKNLSGKKDIEAIQIFKAFKAWTAKINRRPVLLVDNLNLIFNKIDKDEQHHLRAVLMDKGAPVLVGASATTIEDTVDYGAPFYDAFQISYLKKLSFDESLDVLKNLAKITGNEEFENNVYQHKGRLEALYQLTGGTPRTLAILFPLIQGGFSEKIQTDLDAILDAITPLYKARFEELAPQLQVVLDAVALNWDPANLEQLRTITQLDNAQLSPQLKRLVDVGWLQKSNAYKAKGGAYELSERFFNIWYLMRRSSRRQKRELYCLTKFLETFYGDDLHEIAKGRVLNKCVNANQIALDLALADAVKDEEISNALKEKSYNTLFNLSIEDEDILKEFNIPENIAQEKIKGIVDEFKSLLNNKEFEEAEKIILHLNRIRENEFSVGLLSILYYQWIGKEKEALEAIEKSIYLGGGNFFSWQMAADLYIRYTNDYLKAENAYKKAISFDEKNVNAWIRLGNLYKVSLKKYEDAEIAYKKGINLEANNIQAWLNLGELYSYLEKYLDAEKVYKKVVSLDDKNISGLFALANLYHSKLKKFVEAEKVYKKIITLKEDEDLAWLCLALLYQDELKKYLEAEAAYKRVLEINQKDSLSWIGLGLLYQEHLHNYEKAKMAYEKSISIGTDLALPFNALGNLYHDVFRDYQKAENFYKRAIEIDSNDKTAFYNLTFLWRDKMNKKNEARELFNTIPITDEFKDDHYLNEALFEFYNKNIGAAVFCLQKAINLVNGEKLPESTKDDWHRCASIIVKLGYGNNLLEILAQNEWNIIMRPLYVAIEALTNKDEEVFINSVAAEVREPAKTIMNLMKNYMK